MGYHSRLPRFPRADLAVGFVTVIGIATAAAFLYGVLGDVTIVEIGLPAHSFETAFLALPAVGLLVTGYWLRMSDLDDADVWLVGQFAVLGTLTATVVVIPFLSTVSLARIDSGGLLLLLIGTAGEGALLGVIAGMASATRPLVPTGRTELERLHFLHRLLQHNLRNRLNVIEGYADLIATESGDQAARVETISAQVDAALDLLDETRLATDTVASPPQPGPVDLSAMLDRSVELVEATYPAVEVETDYPDGVRVLAADVVEAAFENVFDNAVRHNDRDEPTLSVSMDVRHDSVRVTIADDGPGIDDDRLASVFEPTTGGNHGLGLYLSKELVERSGGEIRVAPNEPRGTAVIVSFPRVAVDSDAS